MTSTGAPFRRADGTLFRRTGPKVIVATAHDATLHELGGPAAVAWEILAEPVTEQMLVERLARRFDTSCEAIEEQVRELLEELVALRLVVRRQATDA